MRIRRLATRTGAISLVSMIDVLMILLIFFMVTSTYADLGMIPVADAGEEAPAPAAAPAPAPAAPLLIRLGADGVARVRGRALDAAALDATLRAHRVAGPEAAVLVLPSGNADAQALVSVLDAAARAGVRALSVLRLQAAP